jgi:hypothetical protein
MKKDDLQLMLNDILRGVARVPAPLITNPTQPLLSLGLDRYEVVACKPLHDLKGHIVNLISELPHILGENEITTHLIECCLSKEKKTGADLRRVVIQVYLILKDLDTSTKLLLLLLTIIKIGKTAYAGDSSRTPRQLLQLYNMCWLHMELCRDLLSQPRDISRGISMLLLPTALNTENQERLFGQARLIAQSCTNHHTDNVIPQVMLRLQAKQEQHMAMVERSDSQVSHVAKHLPLFPCTTMRKTFIRKRKDSWQQHLRRISPFLTAGEGVWWTRTDDGYKFLDGDQESNTRSEDGFTLLHFREHSLVDVEERRERCCSHQNATYVPLEASTFQITAVSSDLP